MTTVVRIHQVLIQAPLQTVFDYVSDLTRHPEWSGGELKIEAVAHFGRLVAKTLVAVIDHNMTARHKQGNLAVSIRH